MPCSKSLRFAGGYTGLPSSSRLTAAEAISNAPLFPAFAARSFITNSAIGLRQILPWQMNKIKLVSKLRIKNIMDTLLNGFIVFF